MAITIKSPADIEKLRISGRLAAEVLAMIGEHVQPGVTTEELDTICNRFIVEELKAIPANVGYMGFTKTICTSVNHVVCHGIPGGRVLKDGDIVNIDVAIIKAGYFGDTSRMYYAVTPSCNAAIARWLEGDDKRPVAVGAMGTHGRGYRRRLRTADSMARWHGRIRSAVR